jgi:hypothetical protein
MLSTDVFGLEGGLSREVHMDFNSGPRVSQTSTWARLRRVEIVENEVWPGVASWFGLVQADGESDVAQTAVGF